MLRLIQELMSPRVEPTSSESENVELKESSVNEFPLSLVPDNSSLENILEVSSPTIPSHTNTLDTSMSYIYLSDTIVASHQRGIPRTWKKKDPSTR